MAKQLGLELYRFDECLVGTNLVFVDGFGRLYYSQVPGSLRTS